MKHKSIIIIIWSVFAILVGFIYFYNNGGQKFTKPIDSSLKNVTLSGTYVCLPYLNESESATKECVFGLKTDDGEYYMVNFGARASVMEEFQSRKHITAKGFIVMKETLNTDHWAPYKMKGIFTIIE